MAAHCFLSPHADDIAFSAVGSLQAIRPDKRKLLVTIFPISCWTFECPPCASRMREVTARREAEDRCFASRFGCEYLRLPFFDSSLRDYRDGSEYFMDPVKDPIVSHVESRLFQLSLELPKDTVYYVPLGIGHHIDHLIVRTVSIRVLDDLTRIVFYEDLPYADQYTDTQIESLANSIDGHLESRLIDLSGSWALKADGIHIYTSQLESTTFARIQEYSQRPGHGTGSSERIWTVRKVNP